jgi:hypothetical protein
MLLEKLPNSRRCWLEFTGDVFGESRFPAQPTLTPIDSRSAFSHRDGGESAEGSRVGRLAEVLGPPLSDLREPEFNAQSGFGLWYANSSVFFFFSRITADTPYGSIRGLSYAFGIH